MNRSITTRVASALLLAMGMGACGGGGSEETPLPGVQALVFVQRAYTNAEGEHNIGGGTRQVIDYRRYVPGGGVYVLTPPTPEGELRSLTASFEAVDISGLDLSFDASRVVFSMRHASDNHYHLYVSNLDGTGVRQLTFGDYDDIRPIFIPGDRIAFVTNEPYTAMGVRADEYERAREVPQLGTISIGAGDADRRLCAHNLSHSADPFLLSDGQIGFSRWEHLGPVNDVKLFRMNPDCSGMEAIAGQFNKRFNSLVQATEVSEGVYYAIGTSRSRTIQAGAVMRVDARSGNPALPIDVQLAQFENLTPLVPTGSASPPSGVGRYRHPRPLAGFDDQILVSWANGTVNDRSELVDTAPDFGIYLYNIETGNRTLIFDDPNMWDTYAIPVAPRDEPPRIEATISSDYDPSTPATIGSIDVAETSLNERVRGGQFTEDVDLHDALLQATRVRIIEGFSGEIGVGMFGLTLHEGAAILGETPVYADGSWRAEVPPYVPYHLQPIDRFGLAIRNQMLWIQAMPGESRVCGGCHASRSERVVPRMGPTPIADRATDTSTNRPIPDRTELPWYGAANGRPQIQDVFDRHCVSCHDGSEENDPYWDRFYTVEVSTMDGEMLTYEIPYLRLTSEPLEIYYENETETYPASYVTLLYPSAMMGDSMASGDVAPEWVVPGSARRSRLIEVINAVAEDDSSAHAWDRPLHPEDVGVTLTREERLMLIQMADLGGQYYSRWNVDGAQMWEQAEY